MIKAAPLVERFQLLVAGNRVLHAEANNKLKTGKPGPELLYRLSPGTNVAGALESFGASLGGSPGGAVVLAAFDPSAELLDTVTTYAGAPGQRPIPTSELGSLTKLELVSELYKLTPEEAAPTALAGAVVSKIGVKPP